MKKLANKSAQIRVIEVFLASFIIAFAFSLANIMTSPPTSPKYEETELEKVGYNTLYDLDKMGLLPRFVYNEEWTNLTAALRVLLPYDVYFNLTIYYLNGTKVNHPPILYGDPQAFSDSKYVASITYGLVNCPSRVNATYYRAIYEPRTIILQLVRR